MLRMLAASVGGVLLCAALYTNNASVDAANADELDNETIMKKLNRKKGNSGVHYQLKVKLEENELAWPEVNKLSKEYADLCEALCKNKPTKGAQSSWDKLCKEYAADAKALNEAAGKKDKAAIAAAYDRLCKSCQACHDEHR